jgi:hypothetical protein
MVYFLGRDVDVYVFVEASATSANAAIGSSGSEVCNGAATLDATFAQSMASGGSLSAVLADFTAESDITGVDIGIGATDEDITYIGQKAVGKVEIKKETTVSLTRKKKNNLWDLIFNGPINSSYKEVATQTGGARWGHGDGGSNIGHGMQNPKTVSDFGGASGKCGFGYRIAVNLKGGATADGTTETVSIPNCVVTAHSVSLNADGTSEETMEFTTQQDSIFTIGTNYSTTLTSESAM